MHNSKAKISAAVIIILMAASAMLAANVSVAPVEAQLSTTQPYSGPMHAGDVANVTAWGIPYLSVSPNIVGAGQMILINMWMTVAAASHRRLLDFKLTITKPDNTTDVYTQDSERDTAATWLNYVPTQVGEYKFKFDFPGTYLPAGQWYNGYMVANTSGIYYPDAIYFPPASTPVTTITVQEEIVPSWPASPLPTNYWTRPVPYEHREWWPILGNYPWHGPGGGATWDELYPGCNPYWNAQETFIPWTLAPNTPHVVWYRQDWASAGIIGAGLQGITTSTTIGANTASPQYGYWNYPGYPTICFQGRAYQTVTKVKSRLINGTYYDQPTSVWQCYDVRTGEVYWEQTGVPEPDYIEYAESTSTGGIGDSTRPLDATLLAIEGGRLIKYNPDTGAIVANVSYAVSGTYYRNGFVLGVQSLGSSVPVANRYRLINWTTFGNSDNFTSRIISNTSYASSSLPGRIDFNVNKGATVTGLSTSAIYVGINVTGYDLLTGATLWSVKVPETQYSGSCNVADHGKIAVLTQQGYFLAWDLATGTQAWKSDPIMDYPWGTVGFGWYGICSAYGMIIRNGYPYVYAFDWDTGKMAWKAESPAPYFETPYTDADGNPVYSHNQDGVAVDGKYYVWTNEHSATNPITRGWGMDCINITTGKRIWYKTGEGTTPIVVHDGYLFLPNQGNGRMEVIGKGKSATTVTSPDVSVPLGTAMMIKGTVLDQSPAQPGTPCVSAASMQLQMEYLHNQNPIGGIWGNETITGVPVSLDTVDPNNNFVHIGDVTTDGYSGTFGFKWTPEIEGEYTVTATFMGDDSYGSSFATTYVTVGPAPEPYPEPVEPEPAVDYTPTILGATAAIIIAIAIVGILLFVFLRKRP